MSDFDTIFETALERLAPAHERLERLRQRISLLQREERHLARALAAREKAIEQARQALRAADEEDERVRSEIEAELQALDPARVEAIAPVGLAADAIEVVTDPEPALVGSRRGRRWRRLLGSRPWGRSLRPWSMSDRWRGA
jgi:septal ring factor EnvC (AmiA/AmiB activator)